MCNAARSDANVSNVAESAAIFDANDLNLVLRTQCEIVPSVSSAVSVSAEGEGKPKSIFSDVIDFILWSKAREEE